MPDGGVEVVDTAALNASYLKPRRRPLAVLARVPGPVWSLGALALGMLLGSIYPSELSPIGEGVRAIFKVIADAAPYIIYLTLVPAVLDMLATGSAAKFAAAASLSFVLATALAGLWAILILVPVFQLSFGFGGGDVGTAVSRVGAETFALAHSSPPFIAIWFGTLVALFLHFGVRWRATAWLCRPTGEIYRVVGVKGVELLGLAVKKTLPAVLFAIGVFIPTSVASALQRSQDSIDQSGGLGSLGASPVAWYFISVGVMVLILFSFLAVATWLVARYTRFSVKAIVRDYLLYVYPFAWATASSAASIPINLERTEHALKVRKEIRDFIIPLGATVNLDGTMMGAFVLTVVAGILVGYEPTIFDLLVLVIPLTVVTIGVPGIPGGLALVAPPVITAFLPMAPAQATLFQAIFFGFSIGLSDQFRTGVNTCNNGLLCRLFEHWYPKHFEKAREVPVAASTPLAASGETPRPERDEIPLAPKEG